MMEPKKKLKKENPELKIQTAIIRFLRWRGWFVKRMAASMYMSGVPDLYATHSNFGPRWIEVKLPGMKGSKFTAAQTKEFPKFIKNGAGIWVLVGATEGEYRKLFQPCNLWQYLDVMK